MPGWAASGRIAELDGWRGVSILLVVAGHLPNARYSPLGLQDEPYPILGMLSEFGVDLFFVISGFIVTRLALSEREAVGRLSVRAFYVRRLLRIVPPFLVYLAFVQVVASTGAIPQSESRVLPAAAFACNLPGIECGWFTGHSWTLAYEMQFYLLLPAVLALGERRVGLAFASIFLLLASLPVLGEFSGIGAPASALALTAQGFLFICAGSVMAANEPVLVRLSASHNAAYVTCGAAVCAVAAMLALGSVEEPAGGAMHLMLALNKAVLAASIAWLVGNSLYRESWVTTALRTRSLRFIGLLSYSLYLWQQLFSAHRSLYVAESWLLFSPTMVLCAVASYYLVERPCARLARRRYAANRPVPVK